MVSTGLSEFTFGFGFLHEQIVRLRQQSLEGGIRLTGAPVFPSPQLESVLGYDAYLPTLGGDYYYQFKTSEYYSRPQAKLRTDGTHNGPYYRIKLHKANYNNQHRVLRILSRTKEHTYYVAPEIDSLSRYKTAFLEGNITENSRKIPLRECDDIWDGKQHYITFQSGNADWIQHSFPRHHDYSILGNEIIREYLKHKSNWREIDDKYASDLFLKISDAAREIVTRTELDMIMEKFSVLLEMFEQTSMNEKFLPSKRVNNLVKASFILSHVFNATLFFVGTQK